MAIIISTPHTNGAGYALVDNTAAGGEKYQEDIRTCTHCEKVIFMSMWKQDGGWCGRCQAPICGPCADRMLTNGCEPFMKKIEEQLEENYRRQQNARVLGI